MIELIKKYKVFSALLFLAIILDILVIVFALVPTEKDITTPGGLNEVVDVIDVDSLVEFKGSFNTIYVYSMERVSLLQKWVAGIASYNEISDSSSSFHLSESERIKSGHVQKNQSIEASLICAYDYANKTNPNIKLDYKFSGLIVRNYQINHHIFKIGDLITKIYIKEENIWVDTNDITQMSKAVNNLKVGDKIIYIRDNNEHEVVIDEELDYYNKKNLFYLYAKYDINQSTASPTYNIHKSTTLGPSGGLMQTLSIYSEISGKDLTYGKKIAGTGTISASGNVGIIGGVSQKIVTAIHNGADVFLCPVDNYDEAYETYMKTLGHEKMILIKVSTFEEAINALGELYEN